MHDLTLIQQNGSAYIDSREVAALIGKQHFHLMRDIAGYAQTLEKANQSNFGLVDFFLESSYLDSKGETRPCYLISKMGCEMVANKLTGEKGVLFTAAYVSKFNEMEQRERTELEALGTMPVPRLCEINGYVQIIVDGLKDMGTPSERIMAFMMNAYEPFGLALPEIIDDEDIDYEDYDFDDDDDFDCDDEMPWYTATELAIECGIYSLFGNPHPHAVSCILNENIFIGEPHKRTVNDHYGLSVQYDLHAKIALMEWLVENRLPLDIYGFERTYHVQYFLD